MSAVAAPAMPTPPFMPSHVASPAAPPSAPPLLPEPYPDITLTDLRRFTVDEFLKLVEIGMFDEGKRVELLEGWIVEIGPMNPLHGAIASHCVQFLPKFLPPGWSCRSQSATRTHDSRPQPDAAIVRGRNFDYADRDPTPDDTPLLIEVSDSTLARDRGLKKAIYGRAGYGVYWIINANDRVLEVYTDPTGPADEPGYRQSRTYQVDESVALVLDGVEVASIPVRELLP